jgi:hypothetical protein
MTSRLLRAMPWMRSGRGGLLGLAVVTSLVAWWAAGPARAQQPAVPPAARTGPAIQVDLHVIGFEVSPGVEKQLQGMAAAGGGRYHRSADEAQLTQAMGRAVGLTPPPAATLAPAEPVESRESEPNDRLGQADPIAPTGEIEGAIQARGDADWYRVTAPRQGALAFTTLGVPAAIDLVLRAWDADGAIITSWFSPPRPGGPTTGVIDLPRPGPYWLEVRDGNNDASAPEPYRIALTFTTTADPAEPNDTLDVATPVTPGVPVTANILPRRDADWYRVEAPKQGALAIAITGVAPDLDVVVRAWNVDGEAFTPWLPPPRKGADTVAVVDLPRPGPYWLEVRDGNDDARSEQPYTLTLTFTPTADTGEPNDTLAAAQSLALGGSLRANILPRHDADWYRVEAPRQGALALHVTGVADTLDVVARVWNADRKALTPWLTPPRKGGDTIAVVDLPAPGPYWIEVRDGNNDARSEQPYTLAVSFTPTPDAAEPNGTLTTATPLTFGAPTQASILPRGDVDVYRFEIGGAGKLEVAIGEVADTLDVVARVWSADRKPISRWIAPPRRGADTVGAIDLPEAGLYFLEVADGNGDARSEKPYRLTVNFSGPLPRRASAAPTVMPPPPAPPAPGAQAAPGTPDAQPASAPAPGRPAVVPGPPAAAGPDELVTRLREAIGSAPAGAGVPAAAPGPPPGGPPSIPVVPGSRDADLLDALRKSLSEPAPTR